MSYSSSPKDRENDMKIFMGSALSHICAISKARRILREQEIHRYAVVFGSVAWILASSSCSSIDGAAATGEETVNFVARTEHGKPANPRVHPGQPYTQVIGLDL